VTDIIDDLVTLHRKIIGAQRVNTENGPGVKVVLTFSKVATIDKAATEIDLLREACNVALGSLKALGAEKGHASELIRKALGTAQDREKT
jgi:hypothetical protein